MLTQLAACATTGGPCTLGIAADLPIFRTQRAFFTDITINGQTVHVRVDTGAATNLLSDAVAARLGMTRQLLSGATIRGVGGARPVDLATSNSVQLGAAHGTHIGFMTAAEETFPPGTDGLLGMEFLSQFDDDLDFGAGHLRLVAAHGDCSAPHSPLRPPLHAVIFHTLSPNGSPVVDVTIKGVRLAALIDTGATRSLLFRPAAERLGLDVAALLRAQTNAVHGIGGGITRAAQGRLQAPLEVGDLLIGNLPITVADQGAGADVDMLLGYDFANVVHLWISQSSHTLLMQYPAVPTPLNVSMQHNASPHNASPHND